MKITIADMLQNFTSTCVWCGVALLAGDHSGIAPIQTRDYVEIVD